ncbi:MAG: lamin tail domain-containing protein [Candidatus Moranbacteria bacterium]|nr:lamin tail domain-containing protein [Candidatus Moranbacteria bacterium]
MVLVFLLIFNFVEASNLKVVVDNEALEDENISIEKLKLEDDEREKKCTVKNRKGLDKVYLNEIFTRLFGDKNEWIELYNSGEEDVDLGGCCLVDGRYDPEKNNIEKCFFIGKEEKVDSGEYKVFKRAEFEFDMNKSNENIFFLDENGEELNRLSYKSSEPDFSYALNSKGKWFWTKILTPGAINEFKSYSEKLEITELMPNADGKDKNKEWLELLNNDEEKIELESWYLLNQSNQKFKLDHFLEIEASQRLKVEIKNTSFTIKNSEGWIELLNPNGEVVDRVNYSESAKEEASLNKNHEGQWLWSIFVTPGEENRFNNPPTYRVDIPDKIYEDVKAEFKIKKVEDKDGEDLKYRWDFGDDSRSYLKETTHTFSKKGRYTIQTRVSDLSINVFKDSKITVKKFPELDLRIVKLLPNPEGTDSKNEKIWIENQESKTVNLKGWVIATGGSMNKLINHYIKENLKIKAGEVEAVSRDDCAFSLLNKKGRVVLKAPDGEVVDKVKYEKDDIEEDQIYYLENDIWVWSIPIMFEEESPDVLGQTDSNKTKTAFERQSLDMINQILGNSRLGQSDGIKIIFFNNWLFIQSQGYFFEFLFPKELVNRIEI